LLRWLCWPLVACAVPAQVGLVALAVIEYIRLDWLGSVPIDLLFVTVVAASGAAGLVAADLVLLRVLRGGRALRRVRRRCRQGLPPPVHTAATLLGIGGRVDLVAAGEAFALTHGLLRPRILLSTGLIRALNPAELTAVLVHERDHMHHRDPLRLLAVRLLAAYACYLPVAGWLAERFALRRELAADRAATAHCGGAVLAAALLKVAEVPASSAAVPVNPHGRLEARISQLEGGRPTGGPRLAPARVLATLGNGALLLIAAACCLSLAAALPGGVA
jgi:Zn-dependent protease with chaperone function